MIDINEQVSIRTIRFIPEQETGRLPIVLIVGLSTVMASFRGILMDLTKDHRVYYVETREKPSSIVKGKVAFDMPAFAEDMTGVIDHYGLGRDSYLLAGFSLGAAAILQGFAGIREKPAGVVLAEPVPVFRFPFWSLPLIRIAVPIYGLLIPLVKWYMRHFMIDAKNDKEVMHIVQRALDTADPVKLRNTCLSIAGWNAWERLQEIDRFTLVVAASKDTLHTHADIVRLEARLPTCRLIDLEDNTRTHSAEMADILRVFAVEVSHT